MARWGRWRNSVCEKVQEVVGWRRWKEAQLPWNLRTCKMETPAEGHKLTEKDEL